MENQPDDIQALAEALEVFTTTTSKMEEAYRGLEQRVHELDQELAKKNEQLAFTSDYLSNLLESMSDGVIAVDNEETITRFNRAAGAILGYQADEVVGASFPEIFGRPFEAPAGDMELRAKSGRLVPVNERNSPVADQANNRYGTVKTFQDLSEIIALREQVRQIDRLAALGEMAATVAHEIRNPLGGIRGFAAFLANDIPEEDPRRRLVDKIEEGAKSLDKVVSELLEFTRPVDLSMEPVHCHAVLDQAVHFLSWDGKAVTVHRAVDDALKVLADADKVAQVLLNVLLNAVQSIEREGTIHIETAADPYSVTFSIADTGCGMNEEELAQVFSPFFTTKERGTGLGLAVCLKIVEAHGGEMHATSTPGAGSTFHVRLPRAE